MTCVRMIVNDGSVGPSRRDGRERQTDKVLRKARFNKSQSDAQFTFCSLRKDSSLSATLTSSSSSFAASLLHMQEVMWSAHPEAAACEPVQRVLEPVQVLDDGDGITQMRLTHAFHLHLQQLSSAHATIA